jgi:hypothetical protein
MCHGNVSILGPPPPSPASTDVAEHREAQQRRRGVVTLVDGSKRRPNVQAYLCGNHDCQKKEKKKMAILI